LTRPSIFFRKTMDARVKPAHDAIGLAAPSLPRRRFITLLAGAAALPLAPRAARAQKSPILIGFLGGADPVGYRPQIDALRQGLADHGYVEGRNMAIEYRWADGKYERLPALAADLVARRVAVIITQGTPAALAAKQATATIPIVMAIVGNPVDTGIVQSFAQPGGNVTGSSFFYAELMAKRLELLKELMPKLRRAGVLLNPDNPAMGSIMHAVGQTAKGIDVEAHPVNVRRAEGLEPVIAGAKSQIEALIVVDDGLLIANSRRIAEIAIAQRLPTLGPREYCEAGGLAAYGVDFPHIWRGAGAFVDKVLKGRKPADLPIEQATRFEFVINLKTAKAIGFEVSSAMSARANQVIE
jgi:putative ABC transport system substrate-binding protein